MNRTFVLRDPTAFKHMAAFLQSNWLACAQQGKPLAVLVNEYKAKRSSQQNRAYWSLLREIAENGWLNGKRFSDETWHEHFKRQFIGVEEMPMPDGSTITRGISTTGLTVPEMSAYIDQVRMFAQDELGMEMEMAL